MASSKYELEILARVKDMATGALRGIETEVKKVTGATATSTKVTQAATAQNALLSASYLRLGSSIGSTGTAMLAAAPAFAAVAAEILAVVAAIKLVLSESEKMIAQAIKMEEAEKRLGAIFKERADEQKKFIELHAAATGRAIEDLTKFQARAGAVVKSLDVGLEEAGDLTNALTQAGTTLSRALDIPQAEAFDAILSSITGRTKALQELGVQINKEHVAAEGLRLGFAELGEEMTESEREYANLSVAIQRIQEEYGEAAGGAESLKEQIERARATVKNFSGAFGTELLRAIEEVVDALGGMETPTAVVVAGLKTIKDTALSVIKPLKELTEWIRGFDIDTKKLIDNASKLAAVMEALTPGPTGLNFVSEFLANFNEAKDEIAKKTEEGAEAGFFKGMMKAIEAGAAQVRSNPVEIPVEIDGDAIQRQLELAFDQTELHVLDSMEAKIAATKALRDATAGFDTGYTQQDLTLLNGILNGERNRLQIAEHMALLEHQAAIDAATKNGTLAIEKGWIDQIYAKKKDILANEGAILEAQHAQLLIQARINEETQKYGTAIGLLRGGISDIARAGIDAARGIEGAFVSALQNILANIAQTALEMALLRLAFEGLTGFGGLLPGTVNQLLGTSFSAKGNVFEGPDVVPFAQGGVPQGFINHTAIFPLRGGKIGVAGEAGREVGLPVVRDRRDGNLKVGGSGGESSELLGVLIGEIRGMRRELANAGGGSSRQRLGDLRGSVGGLR